MRAKEKGKKGDWKELSTGKREERARNLVAAHADKFIVAGLRSGQE